ncbi:MAG TPA: DUF6600 domain-containing protein [Steroidobacteraceae bacterium]|jgi:hypothetical protein
MRALSVFGGLAAAVLICLGGQGVALAQSEPQDQTQMIEQLGESSDPSNPPGRVAQLSDAEGNVSLEPAGTTSWTSASVNRPLTFGDKLWADQDSRAELDIGDAVIRLGSTTGFSFLNLDDRTAQMQVTAGTVIIHVRTLASGEQDEVDTPNLALTLEQPGTYRVEVSDSGDTTIVKVEDGAALVTGGGQSYPVAAQQSVTFAGTSTLAADYATLGSPDSLDEWSLQRDQQQQQQAAVAQEYVPPDTVGEDDLGSYGTWEDTQDWGYAWFPAVAVGWAPYSLGSWAWISPWGWTWVDDEPWGFAPFHYGRWGHRGNRWCWVPGPRGVRPVYAPALVAWVGASASMRGRVGWLPLGPGDAYGRRTSNARYANSAVPGAMTVVPRDVFASAQPVGAHRLAIPRQGMEGFKPTNAAPAIVPVRQSVLGNAGRSVSAPPRALVDRPVVARLAPPRAPASFAKEQAAMRANGGRPLSMTELARMRPYTPATPVRMASPAGNAGVRASPGMQAREHVLQQPALPPSQALRNDRPTWAQGQSTRQLPEQRFTPPQRQIPQQRFAPAYTPPREMAPRAAPAAPARAPEARPETRPPPSDRRADAGSAAFRAGYATQWQPPPPMYRAQENASRYAPPQGRLQPRGTPYRPPMSPPPMFRPIPPGGAGARPAPRSSGSFAAERSRRTG